MNEDVKIRRIKGAAPKATTKGGKTALDLAKGWSCENLIRKALELS